MKENRLGKIGVLAGGPSNERDISLRSGRAVQQALIGEGCDAIFLDVRDDIYDIIKTRSIDVAFIALHGKFGEDGTVQEILERGHIPYTGSGPKASRLALDKIAAKDIFARSGMPVANHVVLDRHVYNIEDAAVLGFPAVVKPQWEGSSIGLSVVHNIDALQEALDRAFGYGPRIMVEEYIDGRELTVGVLDDEPLPVIEIVAKSGIYDYNAKYTDPDTKYLVPAPIDKAMAKRAGSLAKQAHLSLGCRSFSRVDMMSDKSGNLFVLEVNTIPGMTERSLLPKAAAAAGISFGKLCVKLAEDALRNSNVYGTA